MERTKEALTFLGGADEDMFFDLLKGAVPDVRLVDGSRWPTTMPPTRATVSQCSQDIVYLWSPTVLPTLPYRERGGGYDGPSTGIVVQWWRSKLIDGTLRSGRFAVGYKTDDGAMVRFVKDVFAALAKVTTNRLVAMDGTPVNGYRVGPATRAASLDGSILLRDGSVEIFYRVT